MLSGSVVWLMFCMLLLALHSPIRLQTLTPCTTAARVPAGHHPRAAGGNGAPGGSVVLRATRQLTGLGSIPLHVEAERGGHGGKQWMDGKKGADRVSA